MFIFNVLSSSAECGEIAPNKNILFLSLAFSKFSKPKQLFRVLNFKKVLIMDHGTPAHMYLGFDGVKRITVFSGNFPILPCHVQLIGACKPLVSYHLTPMAYKLQ